MSSGSALPQLPPGIRIQGPPPQMLQQPPLMLAQPPPILGLPPGFVPPPSAVMAPPPMGLPPGSSIPPPPTASAASNSTMMPPVMGLPPGFSVPAQYLPIPQQQPPLMSTPLAPPPGFAAVPNAVPFIPPPPQQQRQQQQQRPRKPAQSGAWLEVVDDVDGAVFYYNRYTRQSTWEKPPELKTVHDWAEVVDIGNTGWQQILYPGRPVYFYHLPTQTSVWILPPAIVPIMLEQEHNRIAERAEKERRDEAERQRIEDEIAGKFLADTTVTERANDSDAWAGTVFGDAATNDATSKAKPVNPWLVQYAQPTGDSDDDDDDDDDDGDDDSDDDESDDEGSDGDDLMRRVRQFKKMLRDRNIAPFAKWEDAIPTLMQDPRFNAIDKAAQRRLIFDEYVQHRDDELREERAQAIKRATAYLTQVFNADAFGLTAHTSFADATKKIEKMCESDEVLRGHWATLGAAPALTASSANTASSSTSSSTRFNDDSMLLTNLCDHHHHHHHRRRRRRAAPSLRESVFRACAAPLRQQREKEKAELRARFESLLDEALSKMRVGADVRWSSLKHALRDDPRYANGVLSSDERESIFNAFMQQHRAGASSTMSSTTAAASSASTTTLTSTTTGETAEERAAAAQRRLASERAAIVQRRSALSDRARQQHNVSDATARFTALLEERDTLRKPASLAQLENDPRGANGVLSLQERTDLQNEHRRGLLERALTAAASAVRNRLATRAAGLGNAYVPVSAPPPPSSSPPSLGVKRRRTADEVGADETKQSIDGDGDDIEQQRLRDAERWVAGTRDFTPLATELCAHEAQFASSSTSSLPSRSQLLDVIVRVYDEALDAIRTQFEALLTHFAQQLGGTVARDPLPPHTNADDAIQFNSMIRILRSDKRWQAYAAALDDRVSDLPIGGFGISVNADDGPADDDDQQREPNTTVKKVPYVADPNHKTGPLQARVIAKIQELVEQKRRVDEEQAVKRPTRENVYKPKMPTTEVRKY